MKFRLIADKRETRIISYAALSIMALYVAIWLSADFLSFVIWFKDVVL